MNDKYKKNIINKMLSDVEYYPTLVEEEIDISGHMQISSSDIIALGIGFEPLATALQNMIGRGGGKSGLYKVKIPSKGKLAKFNDGSGYLGSVLKDNGAVGGGQARLKPLVCDPTMLFMASAFISIDKKLDKIQETQQEIINFLVQKEKSELKGDLNFLSDIINNYKYNWNNDMYKSSNHIKVLDIKQASERKIDFYRVQISSKTKKKSFLRMNEDVKNQIEKISLEFKDYQLALYLYSFSSFLEIMLLENFDSAYLTSIVDKIEDYSFNYKELYTKCYNYIEECSETSIQSNIIKGIAKANMFAGKKVENIPFISDHQIDEKLTKSGQKLEKSKSERTKKMMQPFIESQNSYVRPFIDSINTINKLYNNSIDLIFDKDNMYLEVAKA